MGRPEIALLLILFSVPLACGSRDAETAVGSGYVEDRRWAVPVVADSLASFPEDTYFEAPLRPGEQEELLLGERRKFRFSVAVYFDTLPDVADSVRSVRITGVPWKGDGAVAGRIGRIIEPWGETSGEDTLDVAGEVETNFTPSLDDSIPVEWVRSWIDSGGGNHGLLISVEEGAPLLEFPSREAGGELGGEGIRLHCTVADTSGTSVLSGGARLDRFYAVKFDPSSYVLENLDADSLVVGMWESMSNQTLIRIDLPEELAGVTVNQAELVLTIAEARFDEDSSLSVYAYSVRNESFDGDSIAIENVILASASLSDPVAGDSLSIDMTRVVQFWFRTEEWRPAILLRTSNDVARNRSLALFSTDRDAHGSGSPADTLQVGPKLRLLYTPLREVIE